MSERLIAAQLADLKQFLSVQHFMLCESRENVERTRNVKGQHNYGRNSPVVFHNKFGPQRQNKSWVVGNVKDQLRNLID